MSNTIHLEKKDIPIQILGAFPYDGKKFKVTLSEKVELYGMFWDGGSRNEYRAVELATGKTIAPMWEATNPPQFGGPRQAPIVELPKGVVIVEHSCFCGKDMGLTIHARPDDYQPMLPSGNTELTEDEKKVINYTCSYKSSYGGISNYRQVQSGLSLERWNVAKATCITKGLLDKRGAVTVKGRNVRSNMK